MLKKAINFMKNYKLSNFNFRLFIYVLAVTAVGIYAIGNAAEAEGYQLKQIIGLVLSLVVLTIFIECISQSLKLKLSAFRILLLFHKRAKLM